LPEETVNYLAAITPNLGTEVPRSGPFATYASARSGRAQRYTPTVASLAAGCDLNAAYNPDRPCTSLERAAAEPAPTQTAAVPQLGVNGCDLNAAYDPSRPCTSLTQTAAMSPPAREAYVPRPQPAQPVAAATTAALHQPAAPLPRQKPSVPAESGGGDWAIQVGAFANPGLARAVAEGARAQAPDQLRSATLALQPTEPFGHTVLIRARLAHLSASAAQSACARLNQRQLPCVVVRPAGS
jgi:D-alanyl-D-alanine carboxypeptidase